MTGTWAAVYGIKAVDDRGQGVRLPYMTADALKLVADSPARKIGTVNSQRAHAGTGSAR